MNQRFATTVVLAALAVVVAGCVAGSGHGHGAQPAGFWFGLWHGAIAPFSLVVGLFRDGVEIYERANSGAGYDTGFLLGMSLVICGGGGSMVPVARYRRGRRRRDHGTVGE